MRRTRADYSTLQRFHIEFGIVEEDEDDISIEDNKNDVQAKFNNEETSEIKNFEISDKITKDELIPTSSSRRSSLGNVNPRRSSVTNVGISSSIGPSLAGLFPTLPINLLDQTSNSNNNLLNTRRATLGSILESSPNFEESAIRRWSSRIPFLKTDLLNSDINDDNNHLQHYHMHLPHLHMPHLFDAGRRFSFGIRRQSHTVRKL